MGYARFAAMIVTSTVVMLGLMYLNTYLISHVFWSETRAYMALLMGATMAIVMLGFMFSMYPSKTVNVAIFLGAAILFGTSLWLVRSQTTVGDSSYMKAMIPHHSIAIMTSSRANISDPRVRKLADEIVYAQDKEIAEMRYLISSLKSSGDATLGREAEQAPIMTLSEALSTDEIALVDPEFIKERDVEPAFSEGSTCSFNYTRSSPPVVAIAESDGSKEAIIKISGALIRLGSDEDSQPQIDRYSADGISIQITSIDGIALSTVNGKKRQPAELVLKLDRGLQVGYHGYYQCST